MIYTTFAMETSDEEDIKYRMREKLNQRLGTKEWTTDKVKGRSAK